MNFEEIQNSVRELAEKILYDTRSQTVSPEKLGLDRRAGWSLMVDEDHTFIAVEGDQGRRALNYYGGFEYVSEEYVQTVGDWTFYSAEDSRVESHLSRLNDETGEEEEGDEEA
jgi:Txe/YoeB family toxin of Txe-Axe toxin-antitoxin module